MAPGTTDHKGKQRVVSKRSRERSCHAMSLVTAEGALIGSVNRSRPNKWRVHAFTPFGTWRLGRAPNPACTNAPVNAIASSAKLMP